MSKKATVRFADEELENSSEDIVAEETEPLRNGHGHTSFTAVQPSFVTKDRIVWKDE